MMSGKPANSLWARIPLLLGNACVIGLLILVVSIVLINQTQAGPTSNAGFIFKVTSVVLGPLGVFTMFAGWRGLLRDGNPTYCWYALAVGAFSCAIGLGFGLRVL